MASEYFKHEGVTIHAPSFAAKTWEDLQKEAAAMREANKTGAPVLFSNWGDKADEKLKEAHDIALQKMGKTSESKPAQSGKAESKK